MFRSNTKKIIGGVLAGLSETLGMSNPGILRVLFVILTLFFGFGVVVYLLMWVFIPLKRDETAFKLEELKKLHAKGIISEEDYKKKKNDLLSM
jgi:phage shock protein PspC (stress-responsive transcriptional regulator)